MMLQFLIYVFKRERYDCMLKPTMKAEILREYFRYLFKQLVSGF